jgi:Putative transposase, YhgA-like
MTTPPDPSTEPISHDQNFKELISTFFLEFLELFVPDLAQAIAPDSIRFLPQEYFADLVEGDEKIIDLLVEVKLAGQDKTFLFHLEAQSYSESQIGRRMFYYLARLHQNYVKIMSKTFTRSSFFRSTSHPDCRTIPLRGCLKSSGSHKIFTLDPPTPPS